jgi:hypothetical protein
LFIFKGIIWNSPITIPLPPSRDKLCDKYYHARFIFVSEY